MKDLIKALLMNAAYQGAAAVCESAQGGIQIPIDPLIQDAGLQNKGVMVYEEAKIQYAAAVRAFEDKTGVWPDPKVTETATPVASVPGETLDPVKLAATIASVLAKAVPGSKAVTTVADIVAALNAVAGSSGQPKAPGQELPAPPATH
jgi:hypothetical protein